jgi:hypothetical protein
MCIAPEERIEIRPDACLPVELLHLQYRVERREPARVIAAWCEALADAYSARLVADPTSDTDREVLGLLTSEGKRFRRIAAEEGLSKVS